MKKLLSSEDLIKEGSVKVCSFYNEALVLTGDLEKPGFYFVVSSKTKRVLTRYYSGNQRKQIPTSRVGFWKVYYRILAQESAVDVELSQQGLLDVYYMTVEQVENLLGIKKPGIISRICDAARYYTLCELNSLLFDTIEFSMQKR